VGVSQVPQKFPGEDSRGPQEKGWKSPETIEAPKICGGKTENTAKKSGTPQGPGRNQGLETPEKPGVWKNPRETTSEVPRGKTSKVRERKFRFPKFSPLVHPQPETFPQKESMGSKWKGPPKPG